MAMADVIKSPVAIVVARALGPNRRFSAFIYYFYFMFMLMPFLCQRATFGAVARARPAVRYPLK